MLSENCVNLRHKKYAVSAGIDDASCNPQPPFIGPITTALIPLYTIKNHILDIGFIFITRKVFMLWFRRQIRRRFYKKWSLFQSKVHFLSHSNYLKYARDGHHANALKDRHKADLKMNLTSNYERNKKRLVPYTRVNSSALSIQSKDPLPSLIGKQQSYTTKRTIRNPK